MLTKFIDIMKILLSNDHVVIVLLSVTLVSCSHLASVVVYDEGVEINSSSLSRYVYCTSEDRKQGIKTAIDYLYVACGRSKINPLDNITLEIRRFVTGVERLDNGDIVLGHHILYLKEGDKVLKEMKVEKEGYDPFWREVVFIKIRKGVYWDDLNNDGHLEFAVLKTDTGNADYRTAEIYTLKKDVFNFYGKGTYLWHSGGYVLLNCPKCSKHNLEECKKCT